MQRGLSEEEAFRHKRADERDRLNRELSKYITRFGYSGSITTLPKYEFSKHITKKPGKVVRNTWRRLNGLPRIVFSPAGAKYVDKHRKRASRGDKEAQAELEWFRHRALPRPYVPTGDRRCHPHSIRAPYFDWRFESRFLVRALAKRNEHKELWGEAYFETYDDDNMGIMSERADGSRGYKPSASVHDLVRPGYTNSLDRLFGQETNHRRLNKETLQGREDYAATWNAFLKELRLQEAKERKEWHDLVDCPS